MSEQLERIDQTRPMESTRGSNTRTILEIVGGGWAAGLIVIAGLVGFAVGHWTGGDQYGRRDGGGMGHESRGGRSRSRWHAGRHGR